MKQLEYSGPVRISRKHWLKLSGYTQKNKKVMVVMGRERVTKKMKIH